MEWVNGKGANIKAKNKNKKKRANPDVVVVVVVVFQSVGCDSKLDSGLKHDRCAVCGGDSSACTLVSGEYTLNWRKWGKIQSPAYCKKITFA